MKSPVSASTLLPTLLALMLAGGAQAQEVRFGAGGEGRGKKAERKSEDEKRIPLAEQPVAAKPLPVLA